MVLGYTTIERVGVVSGAFQQIVGEAVGSGDATTTQFQLDNQFVLDGSEKIFLDGTLQVITTDYAIDYDLGIITFVSAPGSGVAITATYKFLPEKISEDIQGHIDGAEAEVNNIFKTQFVTVSAEDIFLDGDGMNTAFIPSNKIPLLAINIFEILDNLGNVLRTLVPADFGFNETGRIFLRRRIDTIAIYGFSTTTKALLGVFPVGFQNLKINFDYGYGTVPQDIQELTAILAAMRFLTEQMGGTFDDVTSFTLGSKSVSVGEPFTNIRATIEELRKRAMFIISNRRVIHVV